MSNEFEKESGWGGIRPGAGRPKGKTKTKICVSVTESVWQSALAKWKDRPDSHLIDLLLKRFVENGEAL